MNCHFDPKRPCSSKNRRSGRYNSKELQEVARACGITLSYGGKRKTMDELCTEINAKVNNITEERKSDESERHQRNNRRSVTSFQEPITHLDSTQYTTNLQQIVPRPDDNSQWRKITKRAMQPTAFLNGANFDDFDENWASIEFVRRPTTPSEWRPARIRPSERFGTSTACTRHPSIASFALVPISSFVPTHIQLDRTELIRIWSLVTAAGKSLVSTQEEQDVIIKTMFRYNGKKGESLAQIHTDGVSISLIFKRRKTENEVADLLYLNSLPFEAQKTQLNNQTKQREGLRTVRPHRKGALVGIDPGRKNLLVCAIRSSSECKSDQPKDTKYSMSNKRWQTLRQVPQAAFKREQWLKHAPKTLKMQSTLPSLKTASLNVMIQHVTSLGLNLTVLMDFYARKRMRRQKIHSYGCKEKAWNILSNELVEQVAKTGDLVKETVLVMGDGSFSSSSIGYASAPSSSLIQQLSKRTKMKVEVVNEFKTSQVCSNCHGSLSELSFSVAYHCSKKKGNEVDLHEKVTPWGVRVCSNKQCRTFWCRDFNASRNMLTIYNSLLKDGCRPSVFERPLIQTAFLKKNDTVRTSELVDDPFVSMSMCTGTCSRTL